MQRGVLVGHEVQHTVGDDHVCPAVANGQAFAEAFEKLDVPNDASAALSRALRSISVVISTPTTWPSGPTIPAAIRLRCRRRCHVHNALSALDGSEAEGVARAREGGDVG